MFHSHTHTHTHTHTHNTGKLTCECSPSICYESSSCVTNYKCFRDAKLIVNSNYVETRLGCLDSMPEVNLDNLTVCDGQLDSETYKIKCCDNEDYCNSALVVTLEPTTTDAPTEEPTSATTDTNGERGGEREREGGREIGV